MDVKDDHEPLYEQDKTNKDSTDTSSSTQQHSDHSSEYNIKSHRYSKEDQKQNSIEPLLPEGY
uniref:Uncharacterized protein n=1 Tax=Onchocerca volvulus TaxID=6282 RepID=A0A8R1Y2H4_ONCVO